MVGLVLFLVSLASTAVSERTCDETPFPVMCKKFMPVEQSSNDTESFHILSLRAASRQAVEVGRQVKQMTFRMEGGSDTSRKKGTAWRDCEELHETSITLLKQAVNPKCRSKSDVRTWLSAALTNLETCKTGFLEFSITDKAAHAIFHPLSQLLVNALAVRNDEQDDEFHQANDHPSWFSEDNRNLLLSSSPVKPNLVVAADGSGNFTTISEAIDKARKIKYKGRFVIRIKAGVYQEYIKISRKVKNIMLVGDGLKYTIITGNRSLGRDYTTYKSATFGVSGSGFMAKGITFRNTAGPQNHQAVAFRSDSDKSVLYKCSFEGYQDTLYVHSQRQFYRECYIYGTVDFIFGNAAAVFQNCNVYARRPMTGQNIVVTAQSRTDESQNTGISIHRSAVRAAPDLQPVLGSFVAYLGRPWKQYSRAVFLRCYLGPLMSPAGWLAWNQTFAFDTLYYGEFGNFGPGANRSHRVTWAGYRAQMNASEAVQFTPAQFIDGRNWLPATGVPFTLNL